MDCVLALWRERSHFPKQQPSLRCLCFLLSLLKAPGSLKVFNVGVQSYKPLKAFSLEQIFASIISIFARGSLSYPHSLNQSVMTSRGWSSCICWRQVAELILDSVHGCLKVYIFKEVCEAESHIPAAWRKWMHCSAAGFLLMSDDAFFFFLGCLAAGCSKIFQN